MRRLRSLSLLRIGLVKASATDETISLRKYPVRLSSGKISRPAPRPIASSAVFSCRVRLRSRSPSAGLIWARAMVWRLTRLCSGWQAWPESDRQLPRLEIKGRDAPDRRTEGGGSVTQGRIRRRVTVRGRRAGDRDDLAKYLVEERTSQLPNEPMSQKWLGILAQ